MGSVLPSIGLGMLFLDLVSKKIDLYEKDSLLLCSPLLTKVVTLERSCQNHRNNLMNRTAQLFFITLKLKNK